MRPSPEPPTHSPSPYPDHLPTQMSCLSRGPSSLPIPHIECPSHHLVIKTGLLLPRLWDVAVSKVSQLLFSIGHGWGQAFSDGQASIFIFRTKFRTTGLLPPWFRWVCGPAQAREAARFSKGARFNLPPGPGFLQALDTQCHQHPLLRVGRQPWEGPL